jgi:hypothetical protein
MEKTMTMNVKVVGFDKEKGMVQDRKRDHLTIWREIFRDARSQWEEAEYGRSQVRESVQSSKPNHVAIWKEILKDVRSQWIQAEHGRFHSQVL